MPDAGGWRPEAGGRWPVAGSRVWVGEGEVGRTKTIKGFGGGLREPKPSFSFVFSMFPRPGGPWGIKKHCFFIGFSRFWSGGKARGK